METIPTERDITFRDLLTHTSGLTYGYVTATPVDALYRERGVDFVASHKTLDEVVEIAASLPLIAQPGAEWNYSIATDVLGHLVALISGMPFDQFMRTRVTGPLGMVDTEFHVAADKRGRFATNYTRGTDGGLVPIDDPQMSIFSDPGRIHGGGAGLVSTAADYLRFCRMMLNKGELDGTRLLGRKTVELMTANHLRGDMAEMGQPRFSESTYTGIGFGFGIFDHVGPCESADCRLRSENMLWGGAASTAFWVDPAEDMAVIFLTQFMPSSAYPLRRELRVLTYQAIVG